MTRLGLLLVPVLISTGCNIYGGDDDDCDYGGGAAIAVELRNPYTGLCEVGTGGGGNPCDPTYTDEAPPTDDWAMCYGSCEGLDEQTCLATPACRGAYVSNCAEWQGCSEQTYTFFQCWGTAPSGPIEGGSCEGLDAYSCSLHDDCVAHHFASSSCGNTDPNGGADCAPTTDPYNVGNFESCGPEPTVDQGCFDDWECPSGETCNSEDVCLPSPYGCAAGGAGDALIPCDNRCYGYCVPIDNPDPGNCYEPALCDIVGPACPEGTFPGILNGCYTGYCIPAAECPDSPPACETLGEADCNANAMCTAHYEGTNCHMVDGAWVCDSYYFSYCTTNPATTPDSP
ncbi:MAG TPA: hypothetical protein VL172_05290 [Kofleriaceae bacterium]|nr:hypothetical protein [Kofleriaceae bacterium]